MTTTIGGVETCTTTGRKIPRATRTFFLLFFEGGEK